MRIKNYLLATLLLIGGLSGPQAFAHKVNLFAYAEGDEIYVEGYFVDGKAAQNSKIQVQGPDGKVVHEGVTDSNGQYRFSIPQHTDLKIIVNAGMGHQSDFTLSADELAPASSETQVAQDDASIEPSHSQESTVITSTTPDANLEAVVSKAVNEAIKPLVRELSASQEKASLAGIVGGVGYIIGFLGLFAFFKARQAASTTKQDQ